MENNLRDTANDAKKIASDVLSQEFRKINDLHLPGESGVYIIKHDENGIVYVGKTKNLRRRILIDHLSTEARDTMSALRRSVHEKYRIPFGREMKNWISTHCSFSYLEIESHDMYSLVETLLIASVRSEKLLNKPWLE